MSENKEMYLVHIARESESSNEPVPLRQLADHLDILPASVNQMIKKLESKGKVSYTPYQGVILTEKGQEEALRILRKRRLWEVFLTEHLKFDPQRANEIACEYEHVTPDEVTERLAVFLRHPEMTPRGKNIPDSEAEAEVYLGSPLSVTTAGELVQVMSIDAEESQRTFLSQSGIAPGERIRVLSIRSDGTCLLHPQGAPLVQVASPLSHHIRVRPVKDDDPGVEN
ncbi:MAG: metal-dependent transcriptional regulator [Anaerolineales bacterium]